MKTSTIIWVVLALIVIIGGGWYWYASQNGAMTPSGAAGINGSPNQGNLGQSNNGTPPPATGDGTTVGQNLILGLNAGSGSVTNFLSGYNGMTVYSFANDTPNQSNCTGQCATNWPPYTVASASDINVPATITGKVGTIARADGTPQVTYNNAPLYFYSKDTKPGDTNGQGIGGVWYVAKP